MAKARDTARRIVANQVANSRPCVSSYRNRSTLRASLLPQTMPFQVYQRDPEGYAENVLGVRWTEDQKKIAQALIKHPKVFVMACHNIGKTFFAGSLVNWHYDCFDPSITKTTAPTQHQVNRLTWKEVRMQRAGRGMLPKAPTIQGYLSNGDMNPAHYAAGYTAKNADAFQGDHEENLLILFEEAIGIEEQFWTASDGMLSSGEGNRWLAVMNPTDTGSYAYQEYLSGNWHIIRISAFDHPNVKAQLDGLPRPYPKAISLQWIEERIRLWCKAVGDDEKKRPEDFPWPPLEWCLKKGIAPKWHRPDARFEGRVLGRWPSSGTSSVWSEALFRRACQPKIGLQRARKRHLPQIGCDVARRGEDNTSIHAQVAGVSIHHETYNGQDTVYTAGRLKALCNQLAQEHGCSPYEIPVLIDDDGVGGGVVDLAEGYFFIGVGAGTLAIDQEHFHLRRSELWFTSADKAEDDLIDFSLLDTESRDNLQRQLMAPKYKFDSRGRREVEPKDKTKERIKRSPDDADAANLAHAGFICGPSVTLSGDRGKQFS